MAALETLENYLTVRKQYSEWYDNLSLDDTKLNSLIDSGHYCPLLKKDKLGRQVIFFGCAPFEVPKFTSLDAIRMNTLIFANFLQDENIQVAGIVMIYDAISINMQILSAFSITDTHNWLNGVHKGFNLY